uniref:Putative secreted protein n=1 Tax=Anopheles darlingi TaxID=43151 RepID=A0A2M4DC85_ANODA
MLMHLVSVALTTGLSLNRIVFGQTTRLRSYKNAMPSGCRVARPRRSVKTFYPSPRPKRMRNRFVSRFCAFSTL